MERGILLGDCCSYWPLFEVHLAGSLPGGSDVVVTSLHVLDLPACDINKLAHRDGTTLREASTAASIIAGSIRIFPPRAIFSLGGAGRTIVNLQHSDRHD